MGFNLVNIAQPVSITIDTLTVEMLQDLITCYAADIPSEDVEARYLLTERTGLTPTYPVIPRDVVDQLYFQLDAVKQVIIDIVIGNYHTGVVVPEDTTTETPDWEWGNTPLTVDELKETLFFIINRDFHEQGTWIYDFTDGDFETLRPFLNAIVDLSIAYTSDNDFDVFVNLVKSANPFTQD